MLPFPIISNTNILPTKAGIKAISTVGLGHLFLTDSGNLYAYGANNNGRFGTGNTSSLEQVTLIRSGVQNIVCNTRCTILVMKDGSYLACGTLDAFGLSNAVYTYQDVSSYFNIPGVVDIQISKRDVVNCTLYILTNTGSVYGMGYNGRGQLGKGNTTNSYGKFILINTNVKKIQTVGYDTICCLKNDNTIWFCGGYQFLSGSSDAVVFTSLGDSGILDMYADGIGGQLLYLKSDGIYVRGINMSIYGYSLTIQNRSTNLKITLPFQYNINTIKIYTDNGTTTPSALFTDGVQHYGSGPQNRNNLRMSYVDSTYSGSGLGQQTWNISNDVIYFVSGNNYTAVILSNGKVYGCGPFSGYGTTPGSLIVNYPGNNPSNSTYTLLDLPIT